MDTSYVRRIAAPLFAGSLALGVLAAPAGPVASAQATTPVAWTAAWGASPQLPSTGFTPNWSQEGFTTSPYARSSGSPGAATSPGSGSPTRTARRPCGSRVR
ncbi:hypothetical protein ACIREK_25100 [Streptomyces sp. NPDC102415]|uniref:hypothetical protein n=1 Tax=Streptomyces sp. NPDC102415 TaxID=3366173 RepID=UPI0038045B40